MWSRLASPAIRQFELGYHNVIFDPVANGEQSVQRFIARSIDVACVFDVGAHDGGWSRAALAAFPGAVVHCFEPHPESFAQLELAHAGDPRIVANPFGLGAENGRQRLSFIPGTDRTTATSAPGLALAKLGGRNFSGSVEIDVRTGADYMRAAGLDRVDFLKIDVEGAESRVIAGFGDKLGERVPAIQFEFTIFATVNRVWLADIVELLETAGYRLYRIFPSWLERLDYSASDERRPDGNHLALHRAAFGADPGRIVPT